MDLTASGFDWDEGNRGKCQSHGVSVEEIESVFRSSISLFADPAHSRLEQRLKAIGRSASGRHVFIVLTFRVRAGVTLIRPISARYMHRKEIRHYEEQKAQTEKASRSEER